ncbi:MAG: peroxiredoxin [Pseudomonadota bacterium]
MSKITVGQKVPDFSAPATSDLTFKLSDYAGERVILYFYPRDNTPGCTTEGEDFKAAHRRLRARKTRVFGVSRDSLPSHEKFKAKYAFQFELISDPEETLCKLFDVIREKNMYGKKVMGVERSTFLIDVNGKLTHEWRKVRVKGHVDAVIDALKSL